MRILGIFNKFNAIFVVCIVCIIPFAVPPEADLPLADVSQSQKNNNPTEIKNTIISEGLELVYAAKYEEAVKHFRKLNEIDPESAEGIFFEAFVLELIMDIYRSQAFDDSLSIVVEKAISRGKKALKKNPSARNNMFLGGAYGVRGVREGILGSWLGAAINGRKANSYFEKAIALDSMLYDCYFGIGSYHYWKTKKLKRFFGFFIPDHREKGINELYMSIEKGIFAKTPGRMTLFRIYLEEKRYDDVFTLADIVLNENPDHIFPRWYLGIALISTQQWEKALDNYKIILDFLPKIEFHGSEALIEAWYYQALSYYNLGQKQKAKELLEKIPPYEDKVNQNLFYYDDYIKESKKLLKKLSR